MIGSKVCSTNLAKKIIFLFLIFISLQAFSQDSSQKNIEEIKNQISELKREVKSAVNDVELVKRDQLNYSIEKNLLKETYSSNFEKIQITISIVLGVFTILGFFGLKSINQIKETYVKELDDIKKIKLDFESQLQALNKKQLDFESKVDSVNEDQDRRLQLLEVIEKVGELMRSRQWKWALEYIGVGLKLDSQNANLLLNKGICFGRMGLMDEAIKSWKSILELGNAEKLMVSNAVSNILEYDALLNNRTEFNILMSKYRNEIAEDNDGAPYAYLNFLMSIISNELNVAIKVLEEFSARFKGVQKNFIDGWSFDEVMHLASSLEDGIRKNLLLNAIKFFKGDISANDMENYIATIKSS